MRAIIGYGNPLRGEDAFGIDVIKVLESKNLKDTVLIECFQLTPELCLELQDYSKIIFVDAYYCEDFSYKLLCPISFSNPNISHHISPIVIIELLKNLYNVNIEFEIISMSTCEFEIIKDKKRYEDAIQECISFLA